MLEHLNSFIRLKSIAPKPALLNNFIARPVA